jgi:lysophospholipase L1-like esterase
MSCKPDYCDRGPGEIAMIIDKMTIQKKDAGRIMPVILIPFLLAAMIISSACKTTRNQLVQAMTQRNSRNNKQGCKKGCLVFVGDSNIEITNWQEHFKRSVCNYGKRGSTSGDLYKRRRRVQRLKPETIVMLVGGNDLILQKEIDEISSNYHKLISYYKTISKRVYCISNLPLTSKLPLTNATMRQLNTRLRHACRKYDAVYVNVFPHLYHRRHGLNPRYKRDPIHLNRKGGEVVAEVLKRHLN